MEPLRVVGDASCVLRDPSAVHLLAGAVLQVGGARWSKGLGKVNMAGKLGGVAGGQHKGMQLNVQCTCWLGQCCRWGGEGEPGEERGQEGARVADWGTTLRARSLCYQSEGGGLALFCICLCLEPMPTLQCEQLLSPHHPFSYCTLHPCAACLCAFPSSAAATSYPIMLIASLPTLPPCSCCCLLR